MEWKPSYLIKLSWPGVLIDGGVRLIKKWGLKLKKWPGDDKLFMIVKVREMGLKLNNEEDFGKVKIIKESQ